MQQILHASGLPLAAPSANRSEAISPTTPDHVLETLDGRIDAVIDAGPSERGVESTIVALRDSGGWGMLRLGPIDRDEITSLLGPEEAKSGDRIEAPGQLGRHYAPGKPMRLNVLKAEPDEFLIGYGPVAGDISLSPTGDVNEAASRLYACLHTAARAGHPRIAVAPVPPAGVGAALNDRLRRAAS
jgi:L-threonylcarbamoyladenylate synthase